MVKEKNLDKVFAKEWSEEAEYIGEGKVLLKYKQKVPMYSTDGKRITGSNVNEGQAEATIEDLQGNIDHRRKTIDNLLKLKKEDESKQNQAIEALKKAGLPSKKTSEMIRLERNIFALEKINLINATENNIRLQEDEIAVQLDAIKKREQTLASIAKQMEAVKNGKRK